MHLVKWVPALARDIFNTAKTPFYKGIAAITAEFVAMNLSSADDILNQLKG
jgi:TorA maturation chaperone TorD